MLLVAAVTAVLVLPPSRPARPPSTPAQQSEPAPCSEAELRARVSALLSRIDVPVRASDWRALGPGAVPLLEQVVRDRAQLPSRRAQAVLGLAAIGGAPARALLLETARDEREGVSVRAAAIEGLPRVLPERDVLPALGPVLRGSRAVAVRAVAADVVSRAAPEAGCAAVRSQLEREEPASRRQFARAAERCARRGEGLTP